jgi:hypothetical protein
MSLDIFSFIDKFSSFDHSLVIISSASVPVSERRSIRILVQHDPFFQNGGVNHGSSLPLPRGSASVQFPRPVVKHKFSAGDDVFESRILSIEKYFL